MPLVYLPRFFAVTSAGVPYPFARLYTYKAGTLTALSTFTDETFGTPLSNPVVADTNGLFPSIHFDAASGFNMRCILKDRNDVLIWDEDNLPRSQIVFSGITSSGSISGTTGTFSGLLQGYPIAIVGIAPYLELFESDAAADARRWHISVDSNQLLIQTKTDAGAAQSDLLTTTRTGKFTFASSNVVSTSEQIAVTKSKAANTARTNTTTMSNDPDLTITTLTAGTFRVECYANVFGTTSGAQGIKFNLNFSNTFTFGRELITGYLNAAALGPQSVPFAATTTAAGGILSQATISTTNDDILIVGFITTSGAGTFGFSWAQNSASANATNVGGGSYLTVTRLQ